MTILYITVTLAALIYLGLPLLIKATLKLNSRPAMSPVSEQFLPPEVQDYFSETGTKLSQLGFAKAACLAVEPSSANTHPHVSLWLNRTAGQWAAANVIITTHTDKPPRTVRYVEFVTVLADEQLTSVTTGNSPELGAFKKTPGHDSLQASRLQDVANVYKLHKWRESRMIGASGKRFIPPPEQELAAFASLYEASIKQQAASGYLAPSAADPTLFTPTLVGAYMMTWAQLWPMKPMQRSAQEKRAEAQIRQASKISPPPPTARVRQAA